LAGMTPSFFRADSTGAFTGGVLLILRPVERGAAVRQFLNNYSGIPIKFMEPKWNQDSNG